MICSLGQPSNTRSKSIMGSTHGVHDSGVVLGDDTWEWEILTGGAPRPSLSMVQDAVWCCFCT